MAQDVRRDGPIAAGRTDGPLGAARWFQRRTTRKRQTMGLTLLSAPRGWAGAARLARHPWCNAPATRSCLAIAVGFDDRCCGGFHILRWLENLARRGCPGSRSGFAFEETSVSFSLGRGKGRRERGWANLASNISWRRIFEAMHLSKANCSFRKSSKRQ